MTKVNRRQFLERAAIIGAGMSAGAILMGCKGGSLSCDDTSGLSMADRQGREAMAYVEASADAAKTCANCALYTAGAEGACGSCSVVKGSINPAGYCNVWAALA